MISLTTFDRHEIEQFVRAWDVAFERGEYESMATVYADDAMLVASDRCAAERHEIAEFWRRARVQSRPESVG
jgi:ketosteroid isomerase-like protein